MMFAHILLAAMVVVICRSQQLPTVIETGGGGGGDQPMGHAPIGENAILLDRYRHLVANSLVQLRDSCQVHDFVQNIRRNFAFDSGKTVDAMTKARILPDNNDELPHISDGQSQAVDSVVRLLEQRNIAEATTFTSNDQSPPPKSALLHFMSTSLSLQDPDLDDLLDDLLYEKCCRRDDNFMATSACDGRGVDKRNTVRKVKFHSWGGKRSGGTSGQRSSPANDDAPDKDLKQSKITIRTPFRPWGGKRTNFDQ